MTGRRAAAVVVWAVAVLTLPATGHAAPPAPADTPGYKLIGPPATLNQVVFASDGTVYGTPDTQTSVVGYPVPRNPPAALWRSTDHGHTWTVLYRSPEGRRLVVLAASPFAAYVEEVVPRESASIIRIAAADGRAVTLPLMNLRVANAIGFDAAGTAYGITAAEGRLVLSRCAQTADSCDQLPVPATIGTQLAVDTRSVGVLAATSSGDFLHISSDGGASWQQGMQVKGFETPLRFAGPAPRTLYARDTAVSGDLVVSRDAGLTVSERHRLLPNVDQLGGYVFGSQPAAMIGGGKRLGISVDEGATFRAMEMPSSLLTVDPTNTSHYFAMLPGWVAQSWDEGHTWSDLADQRFGVLSAHTQPSGGSGSYLYVGLWHSSDLGTTWARTVPPEGGQLTGFYVSRDDPRVAYTVGSSTGMMRTLDGGAHWDLLPGTGQIFWVQPGDARHVLRSVSGTDYESHDAGATWAPLPFGPSCEIAVTPDGGHLGCDGVLSPFAVTAPESLRASTRLVGSPDLPGAYAIASAGLLGDVGTDWSFQSSLSPTGEFGPTSERAHPEDVWPAPGGTTFYASDSTSGTWARQGAGRWWRVAVAGQRLELVRVLDRTHALVQPPQTGAVPTTVRDLALIDLAHPAVGPPVLSLRSGWLRCTVPWTAADAETSAYAWLRDGVVLRRATGENYQVTALDDGHEITCRATARTDFGSSTVTSNPKLLPGGQKILRVSGIPATGELLRCSAARHLSWLRDGRALAGRHARTYRVRVGDEGHQLACAQRRANGTLDRSFPVDIPKARGARAALTP